MDIPAEYPDPTWEVRVGPYRIMYAVDGETVTIIGVKLKGTHATGDVL